MGGVLEVERQSIADPLQRERRIVVSRDPRCRETLAGRGRAAHSRRWRQRAAAADSYTLHGRTIGAARRGIRHAGLEQLARREHILGEAQVASHPGMAVTALLGDLPTRKRTANWANTIAWGLSPSACWKSLPGIDRQALADIYRAVPARRRVVYQHMIVDLVLFGVRVGAIIVRIRSCSPR